MFNPDFSRPAQTKIPVEREVSGSQWEQPFFRKLLVYFRNIWEVEIIPPIIDYPDMYAFRSLMK